MAQARNEEERIKSQTDIEARQIRSAAASQDPQFYEFVTRMEQLQSIVGGERTMLLLSTHRSLFESFFTPPLSKPNDNKKGAD